jgi:hypothetical protein
MKQCGFLSCLSSLLGADQKERRKKIFSSFFSQIKQYKFKTHNQEGDYLN